MDNIFKERSLDLVEEYDAAIENRAMKAINLLNKNYDMKKNEFSKYEKSEAVKSLVELSTDDRAKKLFTPNVLLALLQYLMSIDSNNDLTLVAARCVNIFYNISLSERLTKAIIDPLLDHLLYLASNEGNIYDKEMRLKAAQSIENIVITCDITSAKSNSKINEWLECTDLLRDKKIMIANLKSVRNTEMIPDGFVDSMITQRTLSGCH